MDNIEKATLIMDYLKVTQNGLDSFSHNGDEAIDIGGKDSSIDKLKAPFTGVVKRIYTNTNAVWLESKDKVLYADGTIDYMTVLTMHDNDISNLYVGKIIKQGEYYYDEGRKGYTTGNHIHIACSRGKFISNGWHKNSEGSWVVNNQKKIDKCLFLLASVKVLDMGKYNFKITNEISVNDYIYIVKSGDTLTKISRMYNVDIDSIVKLNNIKNRDLIYVDQKIKIPNIKYFKKYTGNSKSIVDALKSINEKSDYSFREKIAIKNGIINYAGTSTQNTYLLDLLKKGVLIK